MIRINLLQSAVENSNLDVVENAISNRGTQQTMLLLIATGACILAVLLDFYVTRRDNSQVKADTATEQATADRLQQVTKQAKELQDKNKSVEDRIAAIMRLRSEQIGPLRLLQTLDGKLAANDSIRLVSIKQESPAKPDPKDPKAEYFYINGYSTSEAEVISFAKNIEFSDGWFGRFTVDARRISNPDFKEAASNSGPVQQGKKLEVKPEAKAPKDAVQFTIKCAYSPQNVRVNPAAQAAPGQPGTTAPGTPAPPAGAAVAPANKMP